MEKFSTLSSFLSLLPIFLYILPSYISFPTIFLPQKNFQGCLERCLFQNLSLNSQFLSNFLISCKNKKISKSQNKKISKDKTKRRGNKQTSGPIDLPLHLKVTATAQNITALRLVLKSFPKLDLFYLLFSNNLLRIHVFLIFIEYFYYTTYYTYCTCLVILAFVI